MGRIIPARITEAREARAMSMLDLAERINVTRQAVSKYENGIMEPSAFTLSAISKCLDFPTEFFFERAYGTTTNIPIFFRANITTPKKVKESCQYPIRWANELRLFMEQFVDFPELLLTPISDNYEDLTDDDVENLALQLRSQWGIGEGPIVDLIGVLENLGAFVFHFSDSEYIKFHGIDAYSSWVDGRPYIAYQPSKTAVRCRFSIAHELGHLLMHSTVPVEKTRSKEILQLADHQADRFAAAFLMPISSFPKDIHRNSLLSFENIKKKWGVSFSAIISRCNDLSLFSENQINYLKKQMTINQYWRSEPLDSILAIDGPEIFSSTVQMLLENNVISKSDLTSTLSPADLTKICVLPDEFFNNSYIRPRPILKILE